MAPSSCSVGSLSSSGSAIASEDDHKWRKKSDKLNNDDEVMTLLHLLLEEISEEDALRRKLHKMSKGKLSQGIIGLFICLCAHDETIAELKENSDMSRLDSVNASIVCKSSVVPLPCNSCDALLVENEKLKRDVYLGDKQLQIRRRFLDELYIDYDALKSENDLLKSNASMPCNSCIALNDNLDKARDDIALLKSNASLPCVYCESLLAEVNELKLTHTTCANELERARAKICKMKSMPCSMLWFSMMMFALLLVILMISCLM